MGWFFKSLKDDKSGQSAVGSYSDEVINSSYRPTKIWAVGGGKGGVGKSFMASNLGILLAQSGEKVLLVDADLGAANLHTFIKTKRSGLSLSSFLLTGNISDFPDLVSRTVVPNLEIVSGANDSLDVADFNDDKVKRLWDAIKLVDHDYVLLDVGPGTSSSNLDIFLMANEGILVTTPDPTSIENTYRFLKCLYSRRMKNIIGAPENVELKDSLRSILFENGKPMSMSIAQIVEKLKQIDHERGDMLKTLMGDNRISIILNQAKKSEDEKIGPLMNKACLNYFSLEVGYLGCVFYEDSVTESIRKREPLAIHYNKSSASKAISNCLGKLLKKKIFKAPVNGGGKLQ